MESFNVGGASGTYGWITATRFPGEGRFWKSGIYMHYFMSFYIWWTILYISVYADMNISDWPLWHLTWIAIFWGKGLYCPPGVWHKDTPNDADLSHRISGKKNTWKTNFETCLIQMVLWSASVEDCVLYHMLRAILSQNKLNLCKLVNFHGSPGLFSLPSSRCSGTKKMAESLAEFGADLLIRVFLAIPCLLARWWYCWCTQSPAPAWDGY